MKVHSQHYIDEKNGTAVWYDIPCDKCSKNVVVFKDDYDKWMKENTNKKFYCVEHGK